MRSVFFTFFWGSIVFCLPTGLVAQKQLVGKITEAGSQLPVAGVTVYINNSQYVTRSADNGLFILKGNIPATGELVLTHISYQKKNLSFTLSPYKHAVKIPLAKFDFDKANEKNASSIHSTLLTGWRQTSSVL